MRLLLILVATVLFTTPARADRRFHAVPGSGKADRGKLQLRVVRYDGSTNGALTVEVRNRGKKDVSFSAQGLYFVPDGDPDQAPQRLGAVGPMVIAGDEERKDAVTIPAGESVTVTLDVFCIDSHRSSPSSETAFTVARHRMPRSLAKKIDKEARKAAEETGGFAAPAAKSAVQGKVWETRDARWIELDGEGAQEAAK